SSERSSAISHPFRALSTINHQRWSSQATPLARGQRLATLMLINNGDVIWQCVRNSLQLRPCRHDPHDRNENGRRSHKLHEGSDCLASLVVRYEFLQPWEIVRRHRFPTVVNYEWRLVES